MIPGVFISGTGTGVGKTLVTAGILRWMRRHGAGGHGAGGMVMKPVQTGCTAARDGRPVAPLIAPDVEFVLAAAGLAADGLMDEETRLHLAPYCFEPACSPHLAARLAGRSIEIEVILHSARWLAGRYGRLAVEGAGGLLVPLNESETMLDLICALGMPVLLVGHSGLGTINHVLLSIEALGRRGCTLAGVLLNDTEPVPASESYIHEDNRRAIESFGRFSYGKMPAVARIPFLPHAHACLPHACLPDASPPQECLPDASSAQPQFEPLDRVLDECAFLKECLV